MDTVQHLVQSELQRVPLPIWQVLQGWLGSLVRWLNGLFGPCYGLPLEQNSNMIKIIARQPSFNFVFYTICVTYLRTCSDCARCENYRVERKE